MGQYYIPMILDKDGKIVAWIHAHQYGNGLKLMEHSYIENDFVFTFEFELTPQGRYHKSRVVWAGDYADPEHNGQNLSSQCEPTEMIAPHPKAYNAEYRYIVNHSKKQFVDKMKVPSNKDLRIHPLPLLTCEGNGRGNGDYRENDPMIGSWARDVISIEKEIREGFEEILFTMQC
jgi:hypothetical protein